MLPGVGQVAFALRDVGKQVVGSAAPAIDRLTRRLRFSRQASVDRGCSLGVFARRRVSSALELDLGESAVRLRLLLLEPEALRLVERPLEQRQRVAVVFVTKPLLGRSQPLVYLFGADLFGLDLLAPTTPPIGTDRFGRLVPASRSRRPAMSTGSRPRARRGGSSVRHHARRLPEINVQAVLTRHRSV